MSQIATELTRRLAAAGVEPSALAPTVADMAAAHAEAVNAEGLRSQIEYLLSAFGSGEIEQIATGGKR